MFTLMFVDFCRKEWKIEEKFTSCYLEPLA